jgi:acyl-CoA synthetase (AMP-forming)/AMP-acid ligase II
MMRGAFFSYRAVRELGISLEGWGETVTALIVLKSGPSASAEKIINHCRKHSAGDKRPKGLSFVGDLPGTSSGKITKKKIRDEHGTGKEKI